MSGDVREDKVRFAFEVFDLDNSGFIEAHELRKIVRATNLASEKQLDRKVRWLLSQCDRNGDGQIRCAQACWRGRDVRRARGGSRRPRLSQFRGVQGPRQEVPEPHVPGARAGGACGAPARTCCWLALRRR